MGTRGSALALWQARWVVDRLRSHHPDIPFQTVEIHTEGDRKSEVPLHRAGDTGLFVKELEYALLNNEVELAVHSLKDMPSRMPPQLAIAAVPEREDPRDSLISQRNLSLAQLPAGACVGTGSPRRKAQLLALRPDLNVVSIRGNVDTRLRKLRGGDYEAIILAAAGLIRLQQDGQVTEFLCPEVMLPAAGQGALGIEIRADDDRFRALVTSVNHSPSWTAVAAERGFMARLGAGCRVPAAAYAVVENEQVWLRALVASPEGEVIVRGERRGPADQAKALGHALAEELLAEGAAELLGSN